MLPAATVTVSPGEANAAAVPVAEGEPVQPAVGYSRTVDPASAVPFTAGVVLEPGDARRGSSLSVTNPGAVESLT